jgi:hypothetical protein
MPLNMEATRISEEARDLADVANAHGPERMTRNLDIGRRRSFRRAQLLFADQDTIREKAHHFYD